MGGTVLTVPPILLQVLGTVLLGKIKPEYSASGTDWTKHVLYTVSEFFDKRILRIFFYLSASVESVIT